MTRLRGEAITVVPGAADADGLTGRGGAASIDKVVREELGQMPAEALQAQVGAYIARHVDDHVDGRHIAAARSHYGRRANATCL